MYTTFDEPHIYYFYYNNDNNNTNNNNDNNNNINNNKYRNIENNKVLQVLFSWCSKHQILKPGITKWYSYYYCT